MTEVRTFFKAGQEGGPPAKADTRVQVPGSTLKVDPSYRMNAKHKPKRTRVESAIYEAVRVEVRHRAAGQCEATGLGFDGCREQGSVFHHIIPHGNQYHGPDDPDNGLWVCDPCHAHIHGNGIRRAIELGYLALVEYRTGLVALPWQDGRLVPLDTPKPEPEGQPVTSIPAFANTQERVLQALTEHRTLTTAEISHKAMALEDATRYQLNKLHAQGRVTREKRGMATYWTLTNPDE